MFVTKVMIDLFSGLGGASEAFLADPDWSVYRIENNPLIDVPNTYHQDILKLKSADLFELTGCPSGIELIWASPPCREFSNGYNSPRSLALRNNEPYEPDLGCMLKALELIRGLNPKYWILENVFGSQKFFRPSLGSPRLVKRPFIFWGNFPLFSFSDHVKPDVWSDDPLRANKKAVIPYEISNNLKLAVENQRSLSEW